MVRISVVLVSLLAVALVGSCVRWFGERDLPGSWRLMGLVGAAFVAVIPIVGGVVAGSALGGIVAGAIGACAALAGTVLRYRVEQQGKS